MSVRCAVDTNVLIDLLYGSRSPHQERSLTLDQLLTRDIELCVTPQNIGEFWNVSTRPVEKNGLGLTVAATAGIVVRIERLMTILYDSSLVYETWVRLLSQHLVIGIQVHDAHLAASLEVHGVELLLTRNSKDFKRFERVTEVDPKTLAEIS